MMPAPEPSNSQEPDQDSCPLGVPAAMCINYEVTGWGCHECTRKDGTADARR